MPAAFDRELQSVKEEISRATERLRAVEMRRRSAENWLSDAQASQYSPSAIERFVGGLQEALARFDQIASDGELSDELAGFRARGERIDASLSRQNVEAAKRRA